MKLQRTIHWLVISAALLATIRIARGDQEASSHVYVQSSTSGCYYAKCIPDEPYGTKGKTLVYHVGRDEDVLVHTFDWFSTRIYVQGTAWGPSVIRFGPWHRGAAPSADHLAIALYRNGDLLKEYSTKEIAALGGFGKTVSHYTVFRKELGYRWIASNDYAFDVELHNGNILSFDVKTGEVIGAAEPSNGKAVHP